MILIDANIFMYAAGTDHPYKEPSSFLLERIALGEVEAMLDAETLQEILHRYRAIGRWAEGRRVYALARRIVPIVLPITVEILDASSDLMEQYPALSARDALHAVVTFHSGARAICSYDRDFDEISGLRRIEPESA